MTTPARLYGRALRSSLRRRAGDTLPELTLTASGVTVDLADLSNYVRVCGYGLSDVLPPTYPHVLAFRQALEIQTDPSFPFPAIGTVHLAQQVTVRRRLHVTEQLELRTRAVDLRDHPRGRQYDMVTIASISGEDVWIGRSAYLHRQSSPLPTAVRPDNSSTSAVRAAEPDKSAEPPPRATAVWRLGADLGRRYGAVSGDRNPIHFYRATARPFGFRRQIAHGMWTFAACLAALEGRLPGAYTVRADFKRPIPLPGKVDFTAAQDEAGWTFGVHEHAGSKAHLRGIVRPVEQ